MAQIMSKAVGIDLGTTNSVVAVLNPSDTEIVLHRDATTRWATTPSCVWRDPGTGETHVGRTALARNAFTPPPVRSVKRLMGSRQRVPLGDADASPEEISALILAEMKQQIEEDVAAWNSNDGMWIVDRAIVTVPAHFDQPQIDATRRAAEQAGIKLLDLLHEPTAAASYHCWRTGTKSGTFLVYDLGGGTFDVSVVRATAGTFEILGISGNTHLGGDDIDAAVAGDIANRLRELGYAMDLDPARDPADQVRFAQLRVIAESTKKALSTSSEHAISETMTDQRGTPVLVDQLWDRRDLEKFARPIIDHTLDYCADALQLAAEKSDVTGLESIDQIILAGGSTHMPLVRDILARELCSPADGPVPGRARCTAPYYKDVDTIVALGAAIRAVQVGGLEIYDHRRAVRLCLRGTGTVSETVPVVNGTVETLTDGLHVEGGRILLFPADDPDDADETIIGSGGEFAFADIPVEPGREQTYAFEIYDAAGDQVATLGRRLAHRADADEDVASSSKLSKAVLLEVERQGRPHRRQLIPAMADLPVSADFEFSHKGGAEAVVFPLYQRRKLIQEITVPVPPDTPAGTPIRLNASIDQFAKITVRGTVGDIPFDVTVEQPADRPVPTAADIDDIEGRFRETAIYLPAGKRTIAEARWDKNRAALDASITAFDDARVIHQFEELEDLLDTYDRADDSLDPPKSEFDKLVRDCVDLNQRVRQPAADAGVAHDYDDIARNIEIQRTEGDRAFREADQAAYAGATDKLRSIHKLLRGISLETRPPDSRTPAQIAADGLNATIREADKVGQLVQGDQYRRLADEVAAIRSRLEELRDQTDTKTVYAQHKIDQYWDQLQGIRNALDTGPITKVLPVDSATTTAKGGGGA